MCRVKVSNDIGSGTQRTLKYTPSPADTAISALDGSMMSFVNPYFTKFYRKLLENNNFRKSLAILPFVLVTFQTHFAE